MVSGHDPPPIVVLRERIERDGIATLCADVAGVLEGCGAGPLICDARAVGHPDAVAIDVLGRLLVVARRNGREMRLLGPCDDLDGLLRFVGLAGVFRQASSGVQVVGQTEEREQVGRIQEEADPGDPVG